ncbi:NAD-dependent epimerase/dehydratase family protein [Ruegeria sp. HKCCA4633]|uniref:NAD-dependent epimerase/dehydratase family protein n=1 Tax=Ruegeria sp. HKCCA4633 TaxID=2682983 RepID=UPI001488B8EE|nr:NAD-dependent epimerase/dehydratase family protein [Ruegeria sp. HKCCA4633]
MSNGRVLITGRHGFTGRYVATALASAGWQIWGGCSNPTEQMDSFDRVADLTDATSVARLVDEVRPDAVVHLAGIAFVGHGSPNDFYRVNLLGTRNLLDALVRNGCGKDGVVLASSANVYGNARVSPISENTASAPANDYAVSKLAMEQMARLFFNQLPIVIARPFNYTGVGQDPKFLVPKVVSHFRERAPLIELGNLDVARDFSDVRDVATVYAALLDGRKVSGETVNICSGRAIALGEVVDMCSSITGHTIEIAVNPAFVRADEIKTLNGDPSHLEKLVGGLTRHQFEKTLTWMLES